MVRLESSSFPQQLTNAGARHDRVGSNPGNRLGTSQVKEVLGNAYNDFVSDEVAMVLNHLTTDKKEFMGEVKPVPSCWLMFRSTRMLPRS